MSINSVIIEGRVTRDPEQPSDKVAKFGVAVNERFKRGDEWEEKTTFVDCVAFGFAITPSMRCRKGDLVVVAGKLSSNEWTDRDGNQRKILQVVVDRVSCAASLDRAKESRDRDRANESRERRGDQVFGQRQEPKVPIDPDDIPF